MQCLSEAQNGINSLTLTIERHGAYTKHDDVTQKCGYNWQKSRNDVRHKMQTAPELLCSSGHYG
jgi:hypothetical protein